MSNILPVYSCTGARTSQSSFGHNSSNAAKATKFVPGFGGCTLDSIRTKVTYTGSPVDTVVCKVYSEDSLYPDTLLATSGSKTIDTPASIYDFDFTGANRITLEEGVHYWVSFERTGAYNSSDYYAVYYETAHQFTGWGTVNLDDGTWEFSGEFTVIPYTVYAEHASKKNFLECNPDQLAFYSDYYDIFSGSTNVGLGQHFITPAVADAANTLRVTHIGFGHGQVGTWGGTPGDGDVRIEIHNYGVGNLDFADVSTTRVGEPSDWFDRDLVNVNGSYYCHQTYLNQVWADSTGPGLLGETDYYVVMVCKATGAGRWRIAQNDDVADGYYTDVFDDAGVATTTGLQEKMTSMIINGYEEEAVIDQETILKWGLFEEPTQDTILDWPFTTEQSTNTIIKNAIELAQETILSWGTEIYQETILPWPLTTNFNSDFFINWKLLMTQDWTLLWPINHEVSDVDILRIPLALASETILKNGLMAEFSSTSALRWDIENKIQEDFILKNKIFMSSETIIKYSLNSIISRVFTLINEISNKIYIDTITPYAIRIESDCILLIPLRGPVNRDFIIKYGLLGQIEDTTIIKFDLLDYNPVEAETILRNALLGKPRFYKITFS